LPQRHSTRRWPQHRSGRVGGAQRGPGPAAPGEGFSPAPALPALAAGSEGTKDCQRSQKRQTMGEAGV